LYKFFLSTPKTSPIRFIAKAILANKKVNTAKDQQSVTYPIGMIVSKKIK